VKTKFLLFIGFVLTMLFALVGWCRADDMASATALIQRIVPGHATDFIVEKIPPDNDRDVFEVESAGGKIVLRGNTPGSAASALNWYLKNVAFCDLSWCGDQLALPAVLPAVAAKVHITCLYPHRVYFNYCTLSYTAAWWDWTRWEREIDFMALNGINMPLAPVGLEAVWYQTLLQYGFTDAEARAFLVGPCFQAWQWMTNIEGHGGPLPKAWIEERLELGRRILQRERELGMTPIQQGFSGYVPALLKEKFPQAAIAQQPSWVGFPGSHQLDPLDPLFPKFSHTFLETEIRLFGTSHYYAADPFHESSPPHKDKEYLNQVGKCIIDSMLEADPQATWVMQAWSIREDIATIVPKDRLLVLDLAGSHTNFWGYPYIVGQLHNFGGRINLHGDLANIASNPFAAAMKRSPQVVGTGLFMEGTTQNPVFYNLYFDMIWRDSGVEVKDWLAAYARRRYGADSEAARAAWMKLLEGPYRQGTSGVENSSIIAARPALNVKKSGPNAGLHIPYDPRLLVEAWGLLLQDADRLKASDAYRFDTVDVGRQVLSNYGQVVQKRVAAAFAAKDAKAFAAESRRFLELLTDVDTLCSTRNEYSFGKWVGDARRHGTTEAERELYERDAAMLVTLWGPEETPRIFDYSWREWGGLIDGYYRERWRMFFDHLAGCLARGEDYSEKGLPQTYGHESFRANDFYSHLADWEIRWVNARHNLPEAASGNSVATSARLLAKYRPLLAEAYAGGPTPPVAKPAGKTYENLGEPEK
jgi:alpha-N-acetylglucosaminidase